MAVDESTNSSPRPHPIPEVDERPGRSATPRSEDALESTGSDDPRLDPAFVRKVATSEDGSAVHLVGVVHDHPASVHRVREAVESVDPTVLALELPPLAVPLFETYAEDAPRPPIFGGEMSAAIQATGRETRVVGVDAPDGRFLRRLVSRVLDERPPLDVTRRLLRGLLAVSRHAVVCRLAAVLAGRTGLRVEVDGRIAHGVTTADPPDVQAEDERRQVGRSRSLRRLASTPSTDLRDDLREATIAAHLDGLRDRGNVVAVLGVGHLDGVVDRLDPGGE